MKNFLTSKQFLVLLTLSISMADGLVAQIPFWQDGMYHNGMHQVNWGGQLPVVTVSGKAIVDTLTFRSVMMGSQLTRAYYLDTVGNGSKNYQLFFGPYWYEPKSGAKRPTNGGTVTIKGGKMTQFTPPAIVVYEINGMKWRDSTGAPPWSGRWIHRNISDTTRVYCPTDSASHIGFTRGFMGMGMMGGGMMWPDSLFCQFEQMHPDSLPWMQRNRAVMGFHAEVFNPQGTTMMQYGMQGHGRMGFQSGLHMRFRVHPDSLRSRGLGLNQVSLHYLDSDNQWKPASNQTVDSQTNSIVISSSQAYSFYAIVPSSVTTVENQPEVAPTDFILDQNYPNPFNPSTTVSFSIPELSYVTLKIYNGLGEEVATIVSGELTAGTYKAQWNASEQASGVYIYRLQAGKFLAARKLLLVR